MQEKKRAQQFFDFLTCTSCRQTSPLLTVRSSCFYPPCEWFRIMSLIHFMHPLHFRFSILGMFVETQGYGPLLSLKNSFLPRSLDLGSCLALYIQGIECCIKAATSSLRCGTTSAVGADNFCFSLSCLLFFFCLEKFMLVFTVKNEKNPLANFV